MFRDKSLKTEAFLYLEADLAKKRQTLIALTDLKRLHNTQFSPCLAKRATNCQTVKLRLRFLQLANAYLTHAADYFNVLAAKYHRLILGV